MTSDYCSTRIWALAISREARQLQGLFWFLLHPSAHIREQGKEFSHLAKSISCIIWNTGSKNVIKCREGTHQALYCGCGRSEPGLYPIYLFQTAFWACFAPAACHSKYRLDFKVASLEPLSTKTGEVSTPWNHRSNSESLNEPLPMHYTRSGAGIAQGLCRPMQGVGKSARVWHRWETAPGQGVTLFKGLHEGREMAFFLKVKLGAPAAFEKSLGS